MSHPFQCRDRGAEGEARGFEDAGGEWDGEPVATCDTVVSMNTVVMWPELAAGLREIKRVLRPDGRLVLSWHTASAPSSTSRRLALSDDSISNLRGALEAGFGEVQRHDLTYSVAWEVRRHE